QIQKNSYSPLVERSQSMESGEVFGGRVVSLSPRKAMSTVRANDRCESYATGSDRVAIRVRRRISSYALRAWGRRAYRPSARRMPIPCPGRLQPAELITADRDPTTGNKNGSWLKRRMLEPCYAPHREARTRVVR